MGDLNAGICRPPPATFAAPRLRPSGYTIGMPSTPWDNENEDVDDLDDSEDPDPSDQDLDDELADDSADVRVIPCHYCDRPVYDDADVCPHCGSFLLHQDNPDRRPWWWMVIVVACLVAALLWLL